jgi:hypothetical protein
MMKIERKSVLDGQKVSPRYSWWAAARAGEPAAADVAMYIATILGICVVCWLAFFLF